MSQALAQAFENLKNRYKPGKVQGPMSFYFSLGEAEGQKWNMKVTPEACEVAQGKLDGADVFLKTSEKLFLDMLAGKWKPGVMDFMRGKIKSNDPTKLTVLKDCFL
ncbi:MAG: SCP2 sterol-binding domain-containing protein [Planctomycetota bacterium]